MRSKKTSVRGLKVKTGCRTCKLRKVKCDEGRPACDRCLSTGRVCDGYGIWGGGGNGYHQRPITQKPCTGDCPQKAPIPFFSLNTVSTKELEYLEWFTCRSRIKFPGAFGSAFWDTRVLQASAREPAVLHALLALSAAHKSGSTPPGDTGADQYEQFALRQYTKAIHHLQPHFAANNAESTQIAMITCLIFVHLEFLRGHYRAGLGHLRSGIRLLREGHPHTLEVINDIPILKPCPASDDAIFEAFAHLNLQAGLLGQSSCDPRVVFKAGKQDEEYDTFTSVTHARICLDRLIHGALLINERSRQMLHDASIQAPNLRYFQRQARLAHCTWLGAFNYAHQERDRPMSLRDVFTYKLLRIYHLMTGILIETSLQPECELRFDAYYDDFASIVRRCEDMQHAIMSADQQMPGCSRHQKSHTVADMGWIPPLYFVALKCRSYSLRRRAIELLRYSVHKEGMWDAEVAANVAQEVMDLEERGIRQCFDNRVDTASCGSASQPADTLPPIPERQRLCVKVVLPDDPWNNVRLICTRRYRDGSSKTFERVFDVSIRRWRDTDFTTEPT
ncbi:hypothetical protein K491DRAFT_611634 [Lophiostoma macrostomum CBS 122681]|uniref:Zn(2)-C6 fungal-type domain-containing protein n=1 Tax=Lophiostoma macrostomum CBS 122681 TaxID=1314788 RepID=A0A6A6SQY8_9PLEO|nr:hypothetical protein K491DRAFT_611634 [Lophiostoma macrostomum CBS 122681]